MTIMTLFRSLRAWLAGSAFCVFSMVACAAPPHDQQAVTPPRLTVADFMGTWKVFAKSGQEPFPSWNAMYRDAIGKTITLSESKVVDRTGGLIVAGGEILTREALSIVSKPVYRVEYKYLHPDTPYPNINPPQHQYGTPKPYAFVYFKVGYFDKTEKNIIYTYFYVGSNDKSLPFALTADYGDTNLYLCKVNPKTGQCQGHP